MPINEKIARIFKSKFNWTYLILFNYCMFLICISTGVEATHCLSGWEPSAVSAWNQLGLHLKRIAKTKIKWYWQFSHSFNLLLLCITIWYKYILPNMLDNLDYMKNNILNVLKCLLGQQTNGKHCWKRLVETRGKIPPDLNSSWGWVKSCL
jgi:hypothetical protein